MSIRSSKPYRPSLAISPVRSTYRTKTHIVHTSTNKYDIEYEYGKPLSEFTIIDCPDSLFDYKSTYYVNLNSLKDRYTSKVKDLNKKLQAFDEQAMDNYISSHYDKLHDVYTTKIEQDIASIESLRDSNNDSNNNDETTTHVHDKNNQTDTSNVILTITDETTNTSTTSNLIVPNTKQFQTACNEEISEKLAMLDDIDDVIYDTLYNEWFEIHQTSPDSKQYIVDSLAKWEKGLRDLDDDYHRWKEHCLLDAVDNERIVISEFTRIPLNASMFKVQVVSYIKETISNNENDLKKSILDVVCSKLTVMTIDKYNNQLESLLMMHSRNKCSAYITLFMKDLRSCINNIFFSLNINSFRNNIPDWYELKQTIVKHVSSIITSLTDKLFIIINNECKSIPVITDDATNVNVLRMQTNKLMGCMNDMIENIKLTMNDYHDNEYIKEFRQFVTNVNKQYM